MIHHAFETALAGPLGPGPRDLPICGAAKGQLILLIPQGGTMRLVLREPPRPMAMPMRGHGPGAAYAPGLGGGDGDWVHPPGGRHVPPPPLPRREEVEVTNHNGHDVYLTARGLGGTADMGFPRGSWLGYEMTVDCARDLICNHDCCGDEPCPGEPVQVTGVLAPPAVAGREWRGTAIFGGTGPLVLGVGPRPPWMAVETGANWLALTGVPPAAGTTVVAVSGADAWGGLASAVVTVEAAAP